MKQYLATMTWFNGSYWSNPKHVEHFHAGNFTSAFATAARLGKKNMIPKGCRRCKEMTIHIKPLAEVAEEQ